MDAKQLKILALACMLFDHAARIFPPGDLFAPLCDALWSMGFPGASDALFTFAVHWLPYLGRLAAPLFLFCLTQGFLHTHDWRRYLLRLLLTALLSQIPYVLFDLAVNRLYGVAGDWRGCGLNILFTLALGLAALRAFEALRRRGRLLPALGSAALAGLLARLLDCEGREGYLLILFAFYLLRDRPAWARALVFVPVVLLSRYRLVALTFTDPGLLSSCLLNVLGNYLGMLLTLCYNGRKGGGGKGFQRFAYAFYPAHFLLLSAAGFLRPPF